VGAGRGPADRSVARRSGAKRPRSPALTANRIVYWIARHWLFLANLAVIAFLGLAFLAPVLMEYGHDGAARAIYKVYSPACHQLAFRSWFLFGEQSYYPLRATHLPNVRYLEEYVASYPDFAGISPEESFGAFSWAARSFLGSEQMGYKVALCQRDVAIYGGLLLAGLLFALVRSHLKPLSWKIFVVAAVVPMMVDGGYQLVAHIMPGLLGVHETIPALRTLTGFLFGAGLMWMTYPHIQAGMDEMKDELRQKLAAVDARGRKPTGVVS
jgi:uncharacterized membrane protein